MPPLLTIFISRLLYSSETCRNVQGRWRPAQVLRMEPRWHHRETRQTSPALLAFRAGTVGGPVLRGGDRRPQRSSACSTWLCSPSHRQFLQPSLRARTRRPRNTPASAGRHRPSPRCRTGRTEHPESARVAPSRGPGVPWLAVLPRRRGGDPREYVRRKLIEQPSTPARVRRPGGGWSP